MICTNILIGVEGAGIEWFMFMPPAAGLIELGWNHWDYAPYNRRAHFYGVLAEKLSAGSNVVIDWTMYKQFMHIRKNLTQSDKEAYLKKTRPYYMKHNPYKYGVGKFDVKKFKITLEHLILQMKLHFNVKFKQ